ncbi:hypothetical protein KKB06_01245, partial [Patescibacteria group bacterium]|nr:hypothetical protein [Patescibacteria group bacterium]
MSEILTEFDILKNYEPVGFSRGGDVVELMRQLGQVDKVTEKTALMYRVLKDGGDELSYECIWAGGADEDGNFSARDVDKAVEKVVSEGVKWNWNEIVSVVVNPDDSIVM